VSGGKFQVSGWHVPDMKKTGKQKCSKPARKKAAKATEASPALEHELKIVYADALENHKSAIKRGERSEKPNKQALRVLLLQKHKSRRSMARHGAGKGDQLRFYSKVMALTDEADDRIKSSVALIKEGASDIAIEGLVSAISTWVEILRELFAAAPESCKDATARIIRKRLTFPINFAGQQKYASDAFTWLYERGFQKDCAISVPVRMGDHSYEVLRVFGVQLFLKLKRLRSELDTRKPVGAFEKKVAKLQRQPNASWRKVYEEAPLAFYGENWIKDSPQMEDYRQAVKGRIFPTHQAKGKSANNPMVRDTENRLSDIAETLM